MDVDRITNGIAIEGSKGRSRETNYSKAELFYETQSPS